MLFKHIQATYLDIK